MLKYNFGYMHFLKVCSPPNETLGPEQKILIPFRLKLCASGLKMRLKTEGFETSPFGYQFVILGFGSVEPLLKENFGYRHFQKLCRPPNETLGPAEQKRLKLFFTKLCASGVKTRLKTEGFKKTPNSSPFGCEFVGQDSGV